MKVDSFNKSSVREKTKRANYENGRIVLRTLFKEHPCVSAISLLWLISNKADSYTKKIFGCTKAPEWNEVVLRKKFLEVAGGLFKSICNYASLPEKAKEFEKGFTFTYIENMGFTYREGRSVHLTQAGVNKAYQIYKNNFAHWNWYEMEFALDAVEHYAKHDDMWLLFHGGKD
ncbi:hypothetical protein ACXEH2_005027 [Klebsiella pneumoniae]